MKILLVAATLPEAEYIIHTYKLDKKQDWLYTGTVENQEADLLVSGIGMVNTAYRLGHYLALNHPDLGINFGIAGSFNRNIPLGEVVEVSEDSFSEMGAEDGSNFLKLNDMGFPLLRLPSGNIFNTLTNPASSGLEIRKVSGITVNSVHGEEESIAEVQADWNKEIESMEGAAFFHAMLLAGIPFYAFRGISNYVEVRNREQWKIEFGIQNVQEVVCRFVSSL